jgi:hypothetical protein
MKTNLKRKNYCLDEKKIRRVRTILGAFVFVGRDQLNVARVYPRRGFPPAGRTMLSLSSFTKILPRDCVFRP